MLTLHFFSFYYLKWSCCFLSQNILSVTSDPCIWYVSPFLIWPSSHDPNLSCTTAVTPGDFFLQTDAVAVICTYVLCISGQLWLLCLRSFSSVCLHNVSLTNNACKLICIIFLATSQVIYNTHSIFILLNNYEMFKLVSPFHRYSKFKYLPQRSTDKKHKYYLNPGLIHSRSPALTRILHVTLQWGDGYKFTFVVLNMIIPNVHWDVGLSLSSYPLDNRASQKQLKA